MRRPLRELLPAFYLVRDADPLGGDGMLAALLDALEGGIDELEAELADRLDDVFVETAHPDELVHFAALVGLRETRRSGVPRALVADVIRLRRRKGTLSVLEQLAADATGWPARAVEFWGLLASTQHVAHPRPHAAATASVRDPLPMRYVGTPFEMVARTAEIGLVGTGRGRHNLPNIGLFLWRLAPVEEAERVPVALDALRYRVHPLGIDAPVWSAGLPEESVERIAGPENVVMPLRRIEARTHWGRYYGSSLRVDDGTGPLAADEVAVCDLGDDAGGGWWHVPPGTRAAVDPERGRLAFATPPPGPVRVTYHRALPMPIGGGGYARTVPDSPDSPEVTGGPVSAPFEVPAGGTFALRARSGTWPVLHAPPGGEIVIRAGAGAEIVLDGLLLAGGPLRITGAPDRVTLRHCTLVPGHRLAPDAAPAVPDGLSLILDLDLAASTTVEVDHSISGPIVGDARSCALVVRDSILACAGGGGRARHVAVWTGAVPDVVPALPAGSHPVLFGVGLSAEHLLTLTGPVAGPTEAAAALRAAIDDHQPDLGPVEIAEHEGRLVVVGTGTESIRFVDTDGPGAAAKLGLAAGVPSWGLLGAAVPDPPLTASATFDVTVGPPGRIGEATPVVLGAAPVSTAATAAALQDAIRAAADPDASVLVLGASLLAVPGTAGHVLRVPDSAAARALSWETDPPAVAASADGIRPGPALDLERVTVLGAVHARSVEISDSIVTGPATAARRQVGCVRYSFVGAGARTPRRFRSTTPDSGDPPPEFVTVRYGHAAFGQLAAGCPASVTAGASDGAELGAFHDVEQPQRLAALRSLLAEYLRFTSEAGIFLVD